MTVHTYVTASALASLPAGTKLLDSSGEVWAKYKARIHGVGMVWRNTSNVYNRSHAWLTRQAGDLVLVWRPCWCAWTDQHGHAEDCEGRS